MESYYLALEWHSLSNTFWCSHKNWFWFRCSGSWSQKTELVHVQDLIPGIRTAPGTCSAWMCTWEKIFWKRVRERSLLSLLQVQVLRPGFVSTLEPFFLCTLPNSSRCSCMPNTVFRVLDLLRITAYHSKCWMYGQMLFSGTLYIWIQCILGCLRNRLRSQALD